ncbi:DUF6207 family protein [Streptomyces sp. NPDC001530]|uniref:DUF6207 family protein n=1 Tax=Streptomyces sp. NPDC001530 TaxID=3364582 RepID=UPI003699DB02
MLMTPTLPPNTHVLYAYRITVREVARLGLVNPAHAQNLGADARVQTDVEPIQETHVADPGLLVIDVAGLDDETVFAFQKAVAQTWATSIADRTTRDPGPARRAASPVCRSAAGSAPARYGRSRVPPKLCNILFLQVTALWRLLVDASPGCPLAELGCWNGYG